MYMACINKMKTYYMYNNYFKSVQRIESIISYHISCWVAGVFDIYSLQAHYLEKDATKFNLSLQTRDFYIRTGYLTWCYFVSNKDLSNEGKFMALYLESLTDIRTLILQIQYNFIYNNDI